MSQVQNAVVGYGAQSRRCTMTDTARDFLTDARDASLCACGHRPESHHHEDECKEDGCWCPVYRPDEEGTR